MYSKYTIPKRLAALIDVKTVVTFVVLGVFAYLALTGQLKTDYVEYVVTTVFVFYFGTQKRKQDDLT